LWTKIKRIANSGFKNISPDILKKELFSKYAGSNNKMKTKPRMAVLFFRFTFCSSLLDTITKRLKREVRSVQMVEATFPQQR
jgi:hypothetical protein